MDAAAGDQEGTRREQVALPLLRWAGPEAGLVRQGGTLAGSPLDQAAELRASSALVSWATSGKLSQNT